MRTEQITIYQFDELDDKAKEKAREWWRRCDEGDNYWSEFVIEEAVREGELLGFEFATRGVKLCGGDTRQEPRIYWRGFWSQGDGACFEGSWSASNVRADKVADEWGDAPETTEIKRIASVFADIAKAYPNASFSVKHSGHYYHKYSTGFDVLMCPNEEDAEGHSDEDIDSAEKQLIENARDFMEWIYRQLERAYEYHMSDENVDESIRINEYEFTEDGKLY